jgi:hypothetical protein
MIFPRFVYRSGKSYRLAKDSTEYQSLISDGWFDSVPAAKGENIEQPKKPEEKATEESPRTRLEAQAAAAGVKIDKRWTDKRIAAILERINKNGMD